MWSWSRYEERSITEYNHQTTGWRDTEQTNGDFASPHQEPRNRIQRQMLPLWSKLLNFPKMDIHPLEIFTCMSFKKSSNASLGRYESFHLLNLQLVTFHSSLILQFQTAFSNDNKFTGFAVQTVLSYMKEIMLYHFCFCVNRSVKKMAGAQMALTL